MHKLIDPFNRNITYLRVSVTDNCNYRCYYCRDEDHKNHTNKKEILSFEEIARIVNIFAQMGVKKVRLTGGEPLLRKDILELIQMLKKIPNLIDIPLSTNAHLLLEKAQKIKESGINRLNISLDTLKAKLHKDITRGGDLAKVMAGIDEANRLNIKPIKLNTVIMRGVNDNEIEDMIEFAIDKNIDIRFIETMPIGFAGIKSLNKHYPEEQIITRIKKRYSDRLIKKIAKQTDGPARSWLIKGTNTNVGVISAVSNNFCKSCNRVRLTAKGDLILCLGQENSLSLKNAIRENMSDEEIKKLIIQAIAKKPEKHFFDSLVDNISNRQMVEMGG